MGCGFCGDKAENEKDIRVSFCPKCKSRNVRYVFELKNLFGILPKMRCLKCGNEAQGFPVLVTNKKLLEASEKAKKNKLKKKMTKKKKAGGKKK